MKRSSQTVELAEIDCAFDSYSCSWPPESVPLEKSITEIGLINPPVLTVREGRLVTLCGIRRVRAAAKRSLSGIVCTIVESAAHSDADLLALNLEDNLSVRSPGLFEKARLVSLLERFDAASRRDFVERFGSRLGFRGDAYEVSRLLSLHALSDETKAFIDLKKMAPRQAYRVARLGRADAGRLAILAETHGLTAAQTGEFAELAREVMARDSMTFDGILGRLTKDLDSASQSHRQPREALMKGLRLMRFPLWGAKEREMKSCLDKINGSPGITVHAPPSFENDIFNARLVFRSCEELRDRARALEAFAGSEAAQKAFGLL